MKGRSPLKSPQRDRKNMLLGPEMKRLVSALADDDETRIKRRVEFILSRLDSLPADHQEEVLEKVRQYLAGTDNEETNSRRIALLGSRQAA